MQAEVKQVLPNNAAMCWDEFSRSPSADPLDDFGWFHVTVGVVGDDSGNDFQVCVATARAVARARHCGRTPGIVVSRFDADSVRQAISNRISAVTGDDWDEIVNECRTFMDWEYEGMSGE